MRTNTLKPVAVDPNRIGGKHIILLVNRHEIGAEIKVLGRSGKPRRNLSNAWVFGNLLAARSHIETNSGAEWDDILDKWHPMPFPL